MNEVKPGVKWDFVQTKTDHIFVKGSSRVAALTAASYDCHICNTCEGR
jgi:hypothetical protein